jgi:DNA-binding MarR family transcriptional regulator
MKSADIVLLASDLRATFGMLKRRWRERGGVADLTPSQTGVLRWLDRHGSASVSRLAREGGMRPQSMGAIVATLEAQGLVSGSPDPGDGRQTLIALTRLCKDRIAKGRAAREDWLARQIEQLSAEEQAHLAAAAAILRRISES